MEKAIEDHFLTDLHSDSSRPIRIGPSLPIAIIHLLKPLVSRLFTYLKNLPLEDEGIVTHESLKIILFENQILPDNFETSFPSILQCINGKKESFAISALYDDEIVKESLTNHFFSSSTELMRNFNELNEQKQLKIFLLIDYCIQDLIDSCIYTYFTKHVPMKYIYQIGTSITEDDQEEEEDDDDDEGEKDEGNPWSFYLTSSFIYSLIFFDEFLSHIYLPVIYEKIKDNNQSNHEVIVPEDFSFIPTITNSSEDDSSRKILSNMKMIDKLYLNPMLMKIIEGMPSPFDDEHSWFTTKDETSSMTANTRERKQWKLNQKQLYLKYTLYFRLLDFDYLEYYQQLLIEKFPWKKLFFSSSSSSSSSVEQESDYLWDKIEYPESTETYISSNNQFQSVHLFTSFQDIDDNSFHETWPLLTTFLRVCQEIFLLYDLTKNISTNTEGEEADNKINMIDIDANDSSFKKWITILEELFPSACERKYLLMNPEKDEMEDENNRMKSHILFVSLCKSIFAVSYMSYADDSSPSSSSSSSIILQLENFRKKLIQQYFFHTNSLQISNWILFLLKQGNSFMIESLGNIFTSCFAPPFLEPPPPSTTTADGGDGVAAVIDQNEISDFLLKVLPESEKLLELIAKQFNEALISLYLCDPEIISSFLSGFQRLYCLQEKKPQRNLLNTLFYYNDSVFSSFAHFCVRYSFFMNDQPKSHANDDDDDDYDFNQVEDDGNDDDDDDDDDDDNSHSVKKMKIHHWFDMFLDHLHMDLNGNTIDIDHYQLPLVAYTIYCTHLSKEFQWKVVKYLILEAKVNINAIGTISDGNDPMYVTALCLAVYHRNSKLIHFLLLHGAITVGVDPTISISPLLFILQKKFNQLTTNKRFSLKIFEKLIAAGASLEEYKSSVHYDPDEIYPEALPYLSLHKRQKTSN